MIMDEETMTWQHGFDDGVASMTELCDERLHRIGQLEEALRHHTGCTDVDRILKDLGRYGAE